MLTGWDWVHRNVRVYKTPGFFKKLLNKIYKLIFRIFE